MYPGSISTNDVMLCTLWVLWASSMYLFFICRCPVFISFGPQKPGWARQPGKVPELGLYWQVTRPVLAWCCSDREFGMLVPIFHPWSCALLELPAAFCAPNCGLSTIVDIVVSFRGAKLNHMDCHCWIIGQQTIAERNWNVVLNETNTDVPMYIEEFILVDVVTLLYKLELNWICIGNAVVYIHSQQ